MQPHTLLFVLLSWIAIAVAIALGFVLGALGPNRSGFGDLVLYAGIVMLVLFFATEWILRWWRPAAPAPMRKRAQLRILAAITLLSSGLGLILAGPMASGLALAMGAHGTGRDAGIDAASLAFILLACLWVTGLALNALDKFLTASA